MKLFHCDGFSMVVLPDGSRHYFDAEGLDSDGAQADKCKVESLSHGAEQYFNEQK